MLVLHRLDRYDSTFVGEKIDIFQSPVTIWEKKTTRFFYFFIDKLETISADKIQYPKGQSRVREIPHVVAKESHAVEFHDVYY